MIKHFAEAESNKSITGGLVILLSSEREKKTFFLLQCGKIFIANYLKMSEEGGKDKEFIEKIQFFLSVRSIEKKIRP